jgi:hypothetical protein
MNDTWAAHNAGVGFRLGDHGGQEGDEDVDDELHSC